MGGTGVGKISLIFSVMMILSVNIIREYRDYDGNERTSDTCIVDARGIINWFKNYSHLPILKEVRDIMSLIVYC